MKAYAESKLIMDYTVTGVNVHDSQALLELLDGTDKVLYAYGAYSGAELQAKLPETVEACSHEKGYRNHPLTETKKKANERNRRFGFG